MTKIMYQLALIIILAAIQAVSAESTISFDSSGDDIHKTITQITGSITDNPLPIVPSELNSTGTGATVEDNSSGLLKTGFRILNEAGIWGPMPVKTDATGKEYTTRPTMYGAQPEELQWGATCSVPSNYLWDVCLSYNVDVSESGHVHNNPPPPFPVTGNPLCVRDIPGGETIYWYLKVPEYSGEIKLTATGSGSCQGSVSETLTVIVPDLHLVADGSFEKGYSLNLNHTWHPKSHYVVTGFKTALEKLGPAWRKKCPASAELHYNQMSLHWGGVFDLDQNWRDPHKGHREGYHADVSKTWIKKSNRQRVIKLMCDNPSVTVYSEGDAPNEGDVYHLEFAGQNHKVDFDEKFIDCCPTPTPKACIDLKNTEPEEPPDCYGD